MSNLTPTIGVKGKFKFKPPFNTRIGSEVNLECIAIRTFADVISQGRDPFKYFYSVYNLTKEQFGQDTVTNSKLISLRAEDGAFFVVPQSFILEYPPLTGIPYSNIALAINLGSLPETMELDFIRTGVSKLIKDYLGVDTEVKTVKISKKEIIDYNQHLTLESARQSLIAENKSDKAKLIEAQDIIDKLRAENTALVNHIKSKL